MAYQAFYSKTYLQLILRFPLTIIMSKMQLYTRQISIWEPWHDSVTPHRCCKEGICYLEGDTHLVLLSCGFSMLWEFWQKLTLHFVFVHIIILSKLMSNVKMSRLMTKPAKWPVSPAKTQISLGIRPVWSEFAVRLKKVWVLSSP